MSKKVSVITNSVIASVLLLLCFVVATTDMSDIYATVSAPIYSGDTNKKNVSLMINVCEGSEHIRHIIDVLTEARAGATFFLCGNWVQQNLQLAKEISLKFEIGNHAFSHKDLTTLNEAGQKAEMVNTHNLLKNLTTFDTTLFAPPLGSFNKTTLKAADSLGYRTIMWSKDTTAKNGISASAVLERATKDYKNGDLILLHPTEYTCTSLPQILAFYKSKGFGVIEVGQIIPAKS